MRVFMYASTPHDEVLEARVKSTERFNGKQPTILTATANVTSEANGQTEEHRQPEG